MYEDLIDFCTENGLNPSQFVVLHFLATDKIAKLKRYGMTRPGRKALTPQEKQDLIDKGFLVPVEKNLYSVTESFRKRYFDKFAGGNEIFDLYPGFISTEKGLIPIAAMDINEFRMMYWAAIDGSLQEHEEVVKDVQYGIEHGLLKFGIEKFVRARYWMKIRKIRLQDDNRTHSSTNTTDHDF